MSERVDARLGQICSLLCSANFLSWILLQISLGGVFFRVAYDRFVMDMMCVCGHAWSNSMRSCWSVRVLTVKVLQSERFLFVNKFVDLFSYCLVIFVRKL